jgi:demethylmenaquinone methyltransferase/2-methoxy-6-polyprenyl-1,4-benzoquinol methylase
MSFRAAFDCLWCGKAWTTRSASDLEGWAGLCPDCLGRADDNGFIAFRLRSGLAERARASGVPVPDGPPPPERLGLPPVSSEQLDADARAWFAALGAAWDDRYTRAGRYSRGPVRDLAWQMELDTVTTWLDRLPLRGEIVELAAGTGWWSTLLAGKGELSIHDVNEAALDLARRRLVAHGLRAHIHVRDAWDEPDRTVDAVFAGFWLSLLRRDRLERFLRLVRRWLRPDGVFAFIDRSADPDAEAVDEPVPEHGVVRRSLPDGRDLLVPQVVRAPDELDGALMAAGFASADVTATARFFVMGVARR